MSLLFNLLWLAGFTWLGWWAYRKVQEEILQEQLEHLNEPVVFGKEEL